MLTVEDGTGLPDADSYASLAEADAYFALFPNEAWAGDDSDKEVALRLATRDLDLLFSDRLVGLRASTAQALEFPRAGDLSLSTRVKRATFELAVLILNGYVGTDVAEDSGVTEFSFKLEGVYGETIKYASGKATSPELNKVQLMLGPLLVAPETDTSWTMLKIVRG